MENESSQLEGRTLLISGGSRGIGLAIALAAARKGANIALLAKTDVPHPRLRGTVHTAIAEIEHAGGEGVAIVGDVRKPEDVERAVQATVERFGCIDIVVNNASAINLSPIATLDLSRFRLLLEVNVAGTFSLIKAALPYLRQSDHGHVLTLSPPLTSDGKWLSGHAPYTLTKMGMTMLTLGLAQDEREHGIAANCLWPRTLIATDAVQNLLGGEHVVARARRPEIMADAALAILLRDPSTCSGNTFIDDQVLLDAGIDELNGYDVTPGGELELDLFVDGWPER